MRVGARVQPSRWLGLSVLIYASLVAAASAQEATQAPETYRTGSHSEVGDAALVDAQQQQLRQCTALAQSPLARLAVVRHALLQRLESARAQCIGHAPFLATLGGLWLEEGEPGRALIWLERSLLLDADNQGAQADHALALAALGQRDALQALLQAWQGRTDVPAALVHRLTAPPVAGTAASQSVVTSRANGANAANVTNGIAAAASQPNGRWASYREATVLFGYESNLDHSPKLAEITLTWPDGPIVAPFVTPLSPRRGGALLSEVSWQLARSPEAGQVWRTGVHLGARSSPSDPNTNWHNLQWAASGSRQWGAWRGQIELAVTWIGGALNEPYQLLRASATGERDALGCTLRISLDTEQRTQRATTGLDGRTTSGLWSAQCPMWASKSWSWGFALRTSQDQAVDDSRPGGNQRLSSLGGRVIGLLPGNARLETGLRLSRVQDAQGYSPLLETTPSAISPKPSFPSSTRNQWPGWPAPKPWSSSRPCVRTAT